MYWLIIITMIFFAALCSLPLILTKNKKIAGKFNITIPDGALKYFYCISAFIAGLIIIGIVLINSMITEKTVQAIDVNNKVKGINISNNDGQVDLASVSQAGGRYVYMKATEGATFRDSYMDTYYNQCKDLGMKVGVYHYLVNTSSPEEQAENFYKMISKYDWDLIPMLDVEVSFDGLEDYIKRFKYEFNKLSSLSFGLYSYTSFINNYLGNLDSEIYEMPLWEANYNGKPWNGVGNNSFKEIVGHQYSTDKHIGEYIGNFNGDLNEFNEGCLLIR